MVDVCYTLTCDYCHRYLSTSTPSFMGTVIETSDLNTLLDRAIERGWLVEWGPNGEDEEPQRSFCPDCAQKQGESNAKPQQ